MRSLIRALGMGALLLVAPAHGAEDLLTRCTQTDDWWQRIEACTAAIDSPRWSGTSAAWAYSNRAVAHAELGNYLEAFDDHRKAVALDPTDAAARNNKGNSHARFREYDRAIREYDAAIRLRSGYVNAHFNRADVLLAAGRYDAADADYAVVLEADPENATAWLGRAEATCAVGNADASIAHRFEALALDAELLDQMAQYLADTGYASRDAAPADLDEIKPGLDAWTRAGCP